MAGYGLMGLPLRNAMTRGPLSLLKDHRVRLVQRYAFSAALAAIIAGVSISGPAAAQDAEGEAPPVPTEGTDAMMGGDYLAIGFGGAMVPSYEGSDDYTFSVLPLIQGSVAGIGISPRPGGLALDFLGDSGTGPHFSLGPSVRLRLNRSTDVKDPVVALLPERDAALELGPTVGISFSGVLNPYDSLALDVDARWDILGAHGGMVVASYLAYTTPLSEGIAAVLAVGGEYGDGQFMDYYHSVTPADAAASGLPVFDADGGVRNVGAQLLLAFDLNGDLRDGGWGLFAVAGYTRLLGDAADSPMTSIRGSADQWLAGAGVGYTF